FIVDNLHVMNNGIVASVIRKMRFLEDEWGCKPLLLVGNYNIELIRINVMLKYGGQKPDQNQFNQSARVFGVYDYFQHSYAPEIQETEYGVKLGDGESCVLKENQVYEIYKNGEHIRTEYYTGLFGRLRIIERIAGGRLVRRVYFD